MAVNASGSLAEVITRLVESLARSQFELVHASADFADSGEWAREAPTAAHWIAEAADVEVCTAREWIRIGRRVRELPQIAEAWAERRISYSKVRTLTRLATPDNEAELLEIAQDVSAGRLTRALAAWLKRNLSPEELDAHHHASRSVRWRIEPDGMVTFTLRLPPAIGAVLIAILTTALLRTRPRRHADGTWPTLAQQHADAVAELLDEDGRGRVITEVVFHVRGDGCTTDDGTPITDTAMAQLIDGAYLRALIHDAEGRPINASARQRHPTTRQKRVVKERDRVCTDCGSTTLLQYDHDPDYEQSGKTIVDELKLRCAPCHHKRHAA